MTQSQAERFLKSSKAYSHAYERNRRLDDWDVKERVARKVVEDFKKRAGELGGKKLLDVGFGNGAFSVAFSKAGAEVSGMEINPVLLDIAKENVQKAGIKADLKLYNGFSFPFANSTFDYVYSTSVLEHVTDAKLFLQEIDRVLKPNGLVYLSFPNRLAPKETHTGLWFISYLPRTVAEWYLRHIRRRNTIAELNLHFLSYFFFLRSLRGTDLKVKFELGAASLARRLIKRVLASLNLHHSILLKTIMVILEKKRSRFCSYHMKILKYVANIRLLTWRTHSLQVMKMCEAFADQGYEVELIVPRKQNKLNVGESEVFKYYGVKNNFRIRSIRGTDLLGLTTRLGKLFYVIDFITFLLSLFLSAHIKKEYLVYTRDPLLLIPLLRKKCRLWIELHNVPAHQLFFWKLLKRADGVVAITNHLKDVLTEHGIRDDKVIVAHDAVDLREFDISISKESARDKIGLPKNKKIVMYIGLFDEWKGYKILLGASQFFNDNVQMVMIGGERKQVNLLREKYPNIIFIGFRPYHELAQNQKAADVLVIPNSAKTEISKYFTSPLKLFAHMASGVPIVASDLPSLREVLDDSTAYFFEPDNPESLAQAVKHALNQKKESEEKAKESLEKVRMCTWDNRAKKISEFLD